MHLEQKYVQIHPSLRRVFPNGGSTTVGNHTITEFITNRKHCLVLPPSKKFGHIRFYMQSHNAGHVVSYVFGNKKGGRSSGAVSTQIVHAFLFFSNCVWLPRTMARVTNSALIFVLIPNTPKILGSREYLIVLPSWCNQASTWMSSCNIFSKKIIYNYIITKMHVYQ